MSDPSQAKAANPARLSERAAFQHALQRATVAAVSPLWVPLAMGYFRFVRRYRVADMDRVRADFDRIRSESQVPLLLCANHLTLIDSIILGWALRSAWGYVKDSDSLAWNTPERTNFAANWWHTALTYLAKCIPITRGGKREDTGAVLNRVAHLLSRGEVALIFPEGGRSRSGRVDAESAAWGVGRIVGAVPGCRVLCIYMRGDAQVTWSSLSAEGDRLTIELACIEPKSDHRGARRSRDLARQIVSKLASMEQEYFDGRK
ncbi:MAG: lysophospholipid acyltransferase family protein [Myxococcota bacterium]|nr:lysophospholipid acyltransferase family protein [Myxococcota bacterium]